MISMNADHSTHSSQYDVFLKSTHIDFEQALISIGLDPGIIWADGRIHRFHIQGDRKGTLNGWYVLNTNGHIDWGAFGNHKTGLKESWRSERKRYHPPRKFDREVDLPVVKCPPSDFLKIWANASEPDPTHPYLLRKGVCAIGIRQIADTLLVPIYDAQNVLVGIQRIYPSGKKGFIQGSRVTENYLLLGTSTQTILIAEGYATACTLYESTGRATAISFMATNLPPVAKRIRQLFPVSTIILMADEDTEDSNYAGQRYANQAAISIGGHVLTPSEVFNSQERSHG